MSFKKSICFLIVLTIITYAQAFTAGNGTPENPYQISTKADLEAVNNDLVASYILINDIDLSGTTYTRAVIAPDILAGGDFTGSAFSGVFDGNSFAITALRISVSAIDYIGLFGKIETGGVVRNLGILNCNIDGLAYLGALTGYNLGDIIGCYVVGDISGTYNLGGLCGYNYGNISNSFTEGTVSGGSSVGGLCGYNYHEGTVLNSYSFCSVSGNSSTIGGFCGYNYYGVIQNCFSMGSSNGKYNVGGFCGQNYHGTINTSYSIGQADAQYTVGGFCSYNNSGTISDCFWNIETSGLATSSGGTGKSTNELRMLSTFSGADWALSSNEGWMMSNPDNSFRGYPILSWQDDIKPLQAYTVVFNIGENGFITSGDLTQSVFDGHNATAPTVVANAGWTFMKWDNRFTNLTTDLTVNAIFMEGDGTALSPYKITDKTQIEAVNVSLSANYVLTNNIDMSGKIYKTSLIGDRDSLFTGSFDGAGFTVDGLAIDPENSYIGLFGQIGSDGVVQNLRLDNSQIGSSNSWQYVGSLCGYNYGTIENCRSTGTVNGYDSVGNLCGYNNGIIRGCNSEGFVTGMNYVGGLCGYNYGGKIFNSFSNTIVNGDSWVGGLVGKNYEEGSIEDSYSLGSVTGIWGTGGLFGKNYSGVISRCYSACQVDGVTYSGGFCGANRGSIINCYATGIVTGQEKIAGFCGANEEGNIENSYCSGAVISENLFLGGFCAENEEGTIKNSFWDTEATGQLTSEGGLGKNTVEMTSQSLFEEAFWTIGDLRHGFAGWYVEDGQYPVLDFAHPSAVKVPDITGMSIIDVQETLSNSDLATNIIYLNSLTVPEGSIIGLHANIGGYVISGTTINIAVSLGSSGDGTISNPYPIACLGDLENIRYYYTGNFTMVADIYLPDKEFDDFQTSIVRRLNSSFDCKGYTIYGLTYDFPIFEYIENAGKVCNLSMKYCSKSGNVLAETNEGIISNCEFSGELTNSDQQYLGVIGSNKGDVVNCYSEMNIEADGGYVGSLCGSNSRGGRLILSSFSGYIKGDSNTGGLCGNNSYDGEIIDCISSGLLEVAYSSGGVCGVNYGLIEGSSFSGNIVGESSIGGVCGSNDGIIQNSWASVNIEGESNVGGLCGRNTDIIQSCYSSGYVRGHYLYTGGLCGYNNGTIKDCYSLNDVKGYEYIGGFSGYNDDVIENCYSLGNVQGSDYIGGFCGKKPRYSEYDNFVNCFWDVDTSGLDSSYGGDGKMTVQMQTLSTFVDAGWDFVGEGDNGDMEVWFLPDGDYPRLYWEAEIGDVNYDGFVDEFDLDVIISQWLGEALEDQRLTADINGDNWVDNVDLAMLANALRPPSADINSDGVIDELDLRILCDNWLAEEYNIAADLNEDGVVDFLDYSILASQWLAVSAGN